MYGRSRDRVCGSTTKRWTTEGRIDGVHELRDGDHDDDDRRAASTTAHGRVDEHGRAGERDDHEHAQPAGAATCTSV